MYIKAGDRTDLQFKLNDLWDISSDLELEQYNKAVEFYDAVYEYINKN